MLNIGTKAPDFALSDQNGNLVRLSDFAGKKVVLYFYSKDNTSGCTKQACAFGLAHLHFQALGVAVIGISKDSAESHRKFADKHALPFTLLADPEREALAAYDVLKEKTTAGKTTLTTLRTTYIIDEHGTIVHVMPKAKPDTNAEDVLAWLKAEG